MLIPGEKTVVVLFDWDRGRAAQAVAMRLAKLAEALGAVLVAFGTKTLAVGFSDGDEEEAVHFAARAARKASSEQAPLRIAIAYGVLDQAFEGSAFVCLATGEPLDVGVSLLELAQPGQVVVDGDLPCLRASDLSGIPLSAAQTKIPRAGISLDVEHPFVRDSMSLYEDTQTREPQRQDSGSFEMIDLAREALMSGDTASLDVALQQLRVTGEHKDLAARLAGVLALTRGAKEEGLRILRKAALDEKEEHRRARSLLAYSVGLAAAGRHEEALLEALSALALTRAQSDANGELACVKFLAQLSRDAGREDAALAWASAVG